MEESGRVLKQLGLEGEIKQLPELPRGEYRLHLNNTKLKDNIVYVRIHSYEQLRNMIGVPLSSIAKNPDYKMAEELELALKGVRKDAILSEEDKQLLAYAYLYAPQEYMRLSAQQHTEVLDYLMGHTEVLPVLAGAELAVHAGETYEIKGMPLAVFQSITIIGDGRIVVASDVKKVACDSFEHKEEE